MSEDGKTYEFDEFRLIADERLLLCNEERVSLTPRAFDLLLKLVQNPDHLLEKKALMNEVWGDAVVEEGNLNRTISTLRKALGEGPHENHYIETVPKVGYRFVGKLKIPALPETENEAGISRTAAEKPKSSLKTGRFRFALTVLAGLSIPGVILPVLYYFFSSPNSHDLSDKISARPVRLTRSQFNEEDAVWTADNHIRFVRFITDDYSESFIMNSDGGELRRANTEIRNLRVGNWSPNRQKVVFWKEGDSENTAYLADATGSNEIKLPFVPGNMNWSPDGKYFVYQSPHPADKANSDIYLYTLETAKIINLTNAISFDADPSFSPDGRQIAFVSDRDGNQEVYLMRSDGSGVRRLTVHPARDSFPVFSPDGTQIAFLSNRENEKVGIFLTNVNDSPTPPVKVSDTSYNAEIRRRSWSPDGTRMVFTSDKEDGKYNIYTMPVEPYKPGFLLADETGEILSASISADGRKIAYAAKSSDGKGELRIFDREKQVTDLLLESENSDLTPAFSPDGTSIVFNRKTGGNTDVWVIGTDGGGLRNLTRSPAQEGHAVWSPDGREIIFTSNRDGDYERHHLFRMNADGAGQRRLTKREGYEMTPAWSPDGKTVAFAGDRQDGKSKGLDIFLLDPENANRERILAVHASHDTSPSFSPDGQKIAFVSRSDGNSEIYLINRDGSGLLRLTRNAAEDIAPFWSPRGKKVIFSSNRSGKFALYELEIP